MKVLQIMNPINLITPSSSAGKRRLVIVVAGTANLAQVCSLRGDRDANQTAWAAWPDDRARHAIL